jgi:hypothetical protein
MMAKRLAKERRYCHLGSSRFDGVADLAPEPLEPFVEHLVTVMKQQNDPDPE